MESLQQSSVLEQPDRYWISILTLVNWVGNVLLPLYGAGQVVLAVVHFAGLLERMTIGEAWVRQPGRGDVLFRTVRALRLGEFWIQHGTPECARSEAMPYARDTRNRNLQTRVTFIVLELEDLFIC